MRGLHLHGKVENYRFVRAKIRGNDGASIGLGNRPAGDFERRDIPELGVPFCDLLGSHFSAGVKLRSSVGVPTLWIVASSGRITRSQKSPKPSASSRSRA